MRDNAPWEAVPPDQQLFVLITGANSGIGFGTCQRLIDEYLASRSLTSHLIILPTTRSAKKSLETVRSLREYAEQTARATAASLASRAAGPYTWRDSTSRIHVLSPVIDLCDLRAVHGLAEQLCRGTMSNPQGLEGEYLVDVKIPRIDSLVCNAAYGGWVGFSLWGAIKMILTKGFLESITFPEFKVALPTCVLNDRPRFHYPAKPLLGEVFTASIFGHYLLGRYLQPLLRRANPASASVEPARIVFTSSVEAYEKCLGLDDIQCLQGTNPYESVKRLTDVLALSHSLPSVRSISAAYLLTSPANLSRRHDQQDGKTIPPKIILTHPGIVASALFPVPWFIFWVYELCINIGRLLGSPWHNVNGYSGAKSASWACLTPMAELEDMGTERVKWGSSSDAALQVRVKKTEVEQWGWDGRMEDAVSLGEGDREAGGLRKNKGRKQGARLPTERSLMSFEETGRACWEEMERLREEWEALLEMGDIEE